MIQYLKEVFYMRNITKFGSSLLVAGTLLLTSGCSCSMKAKKIDEQTEQLKLSDIEYLDDKLVDYIATYKLVKNDGVTESLEEYTVKRDVDGNIYYLTTTFGSAAVGSEMKTTKIDEKLFMDGETLKYQKGENVADSIISLDHTTPSHAFIDLSTLKATSDYYGYTHSVYNEYRSVPFNACASNNTVIADLPDYSSGFGIQHLSCNAKKKTFGKEYTYEINYSISVSEIVSITVKADKNNKITSVTKVNTFSVNETDKIVTTMTFNVSYTNV